MLAWAINWIFFDIDSKHHKHALTRSFHYSSPVYEEANVVVGYHSVLNFIVIGYTLAGAALPQIVVASDCKNANREDLTDEFAALSLNPLPSYLRWYFSGGLSLGTLAMGILLVYDLTQLFFKPCIREPDTTLNSHDGLDWLFECS